MMIDYVKTHLVALCWRAFGWIRRHGWTGHGRWNASALLRQR